MLTQNYPPLIGGIELYVQNLSIELIMRGHEVSVATLWHEGSPEFEIDQGIRVYRIRGSIQRVARLLFINPGRIYAPPFPDPELLWELQKIIVQERPDIVHAHNWIVHSYLPIKVWSRAAMVVTLHDYDLQCSIWSLFYRNTTCSGPSLIKCLACAANYYGFLKGVSTVLSSRVMSAFERLATDMFIPVSQAVAVGNGLVGSGMSYRVIPAFIRDSLGSSNIDCSPYLSQLPTKNYLLFVGALGQIKGAICTAARI